MFAASRIQFAPLEGIVLVRRALTVAFGGLPAALDCARVAAGWLLQILHVLIRGRRR